MKGNFHVQFLGEGVAATSPPYPTPGWATTQVYPAPRPPDPEARGPRPEAPRIGLTRAPEPHGEAVNGKTILLQASTNTGVGAS